MFVANPRALVLTGLLVSALLAACSPSPSTTSATSPPSGAATSAPAAGGAATEEPVAAASVPTATPNLSGKITIAGSSALQPLVDQAAKNFQSVNKSVQITVSAGGSGSGRTGVCQGSLDIGMSDVPFTSQELESLNCSDQVSTAVAQEAFAVATNPKGPGSVKALTMEQMQGIFGGTITNWSQVGGDNQGVVLINRLKGSGTRQSMANYLYGGDDTQFAVGASEEDNSQTVANTVGQTPGAVSYLGLAFLEQPNIMTMGIQQADGTVVTPTHDTVASGKWPIGGPGLAITKGAANEIQAAFINYMLSPEFEQDAIWNGLGFIPPANPKIGNATGS